jgi:hypothetical protein
MRPLLPSNELANPSFIGGSSASWTLTTVPPTPPATWSIASGSPFSDGHSVAWSGSGIGEAYNLSRIPCVPGEVIKATCQALGEPNATGIAELRIRFYDANNNYLSYSYSISTPNNYVWTYLLAAKVTPANAVYALVTFAVINSTGGPRWFATQFYGANLVASLHPLPFKQPLQYYLNLFTSQYRPSARLNAWQKALMTPIDDLTACLQTVNILYDLDNAFGAQLDVLGEIIGASRIVPFQPSNGISPVLDDDTYRLLLYATQAKNTWDGTIEGIYNSWQFLFPNGLLSILDNQNMTATITTSGSFSSIQLDLIHNGFIVPRPEGVQYNPGGTGTSVGLFGFDRNDSQVSGFDIGKFA